MIIYAGTTGYLDKIDGQGCRPVRAGAAAHLRSKHQDLLDYITTEDPKMKGEAEDKIKAALDEFAKDFA